MMELICGVDEAGRGPLAGPVTAAAVILPAGFPIETLNDSKKLPAARRRELSDLIRKTSVAWGLGWASHIEIDELNILAASLLAMRRAVLSLEVQPSSIIVDGLHVPLVPFPARALVKADTSVPEVMAASILAKTARDMWMIEYSSRDPRYGFERHMGYPTLFHRQQLRRHGRSTIHRRSFRVS